MLRRTHAIFAMAVAFFLRLTPSQIIASGFFGIVSDMDHTLGLRHRGFTHSILFAVLAYAVTSMLFPNLALPALVGITTHIFADMLNPEGVELFYPSRKNYRIAKFRFDSLLGNGIVIALSVMLVVLRFKYCVSVKPLEELSLTLHELVRSAGFR